MEMIYVYETEAIVIFDGQAMGTITPTEENLKKYEDKGFKIIDCRNTNK